MTLEPKQLLRDAGVGFVIGLIVALGIGWGVGNANASEGPPPASAR